jgi:hypothetical protein
MERLLYIVAREQPLLVGYLRTRAGAAAPQGHLVEIKLDGRRGERRRSSGTRDPERRTGERRVRPSLDDDLRSHGYAVVPSEGGASWADEPTPVVAWRPRSSWGRRAARAGRRRWARWGSIVVLLAAVVGALVVARSIQVTSVPPPPAPQAAAPQAAAPQAAAPQAAREAAPPAASRIEEAAPSPPAPQAEPVAPAAPPPPARPPAPARIVSTRSSGLVMSVDPGTRTLVLEDRGGTGAAGRRVELAPDARVVLSERDEQAEDLGHPFKDTVIGLSEVRRGDYVVVEMRGPQGKELARSVVVTFRPR